MRIGILHGWMLEGSGSNIYTRALAGALADRGHEIHVICQEPHPEDFPGGFKVHVPRLDPGVMPVYVGDTAYPGFSEVRTFVELEDDPRLERYLADFTAAAEAVCRRHRIEILHANHIYPMPEVARRVKERLGVPFIVYPHGSEIEYSLKKSKKLAQAGRKTIDAADALIVGNDIVSERIFRLYPDQAPQWKKKHEIVSVGVDPDIFAPVAKDDRPKVVELIAAKKLPKTGKTRAMTKDLLAERFKDDDSLKDAVVKARAGYDHKVPDADIVEKLRAVDWRQAKVLVYGGKLIVGKGLHDLFIALPGIIAENPTALLVVVGEGPFRETLELMLQALSAGDGALLEKIVRIGWGLDIFPPRPLEKVEAYLKKIGSERLLELGKKTKPIEHVIFTGYLKHDLMRHVFPRADLAVFPSEVAEAYPLVLLESISAGVLPIASYFEGLKDGLDAIGAELGPELAPYMRIDMDVEKRIESMTANINALLSREPVWREKCRRLAVDVYSWSAVAAKMEAVYARLTG